MSSITLDFSGRRFTCWIGVKEGSSDDKCKVNTISVHSKLHSVTSAKTTLSYERYLKRCSVTSGRINSTQSVAVSTSLSLCYDHKSQTV